jgi:hypothetical protein
MYAAISTGNTKMGAVPSVSLPPIKTCAPGLPCFKYCYAKQNYIQFPIVKRAYDRNLARYLANPDRYFRSILWYVRTKKLDMFRWHVSGDVPSTEYLRGMIRVANLAPNCKFLAFTKKYELVKGVEFPKNLTVVLSAWPKVKLPRTRLPKAFVQDGNERRRRNAIQCQGGCSTCGLCWNLRMSKRNVMFPLHGGWVNSAKARRERKLQKLAEEKSVAV